MSADIPNDELVAICEWAARHQRNMTNEVAAHFKLTPEAARALIKSRRQRGAAIPYVRVEGKRRPVNVIKVPVETPAIRCDCGERFDVHSWEPTRRLIAHTLSVHGRPPFRHERIPQEVAA